MISKEEMLELIVASCPSFKSIYDKEFVSKDESLWFDDNGEVNYYIVLGDFAKHVVELFRDGKTDEVSKVFSVVERLHNDGDNYVKEAVTIGFLEGIQNVAGNNNVHPKEFVQFLKPETKKWWQNLNDFWSSKKPGGG